MSEAGSIHVRSATLDDVPSIVDFNCRLAEESEAKMLDRDVLARGVRRALAHPDLCRYYLAEVDGEVVGQAMFTVEMSDWRDGLIWWLQSVYVLSDFRRRGVFARLFEHIQQSAQTSGDIRAIRLYVDDTNHAAIKTYRGLGFQPAGYHVLEMDWSGAVQSQK